MKYFERERKVIVRSVGWLIASVIGSWSEFTHAQLYWSDLAEDAALRATLALEPMPSAYRLVSVDVASMSQKLTEFRAKSASEQTIISLPQPDGGARDFVVQPSGVMPPELASKWSEISAYQGFAVDDPTVSVRFEISQRGLSAQVLEPGNRWMVDPKPGVQKGLAISYYSDDTKRPSDTGICELGTSRTAPGKPKGSLFEISTVSRILLYIRAFGAVCN
jgi:hypothetical protein